MNRHPGLFSLALLGTLLTIPLSASRALAQGTPPPPAAGGGALTAPPAAGNIDAIRGSSSVASATPAIKTFIDGYVGPLTSGAPAAAAAARDKLIDAAGAGASPAFLAAYAGLLDAAIAPALQNDSEIVRLNAGIVVARVAERSDSGALSPATLILLNDKSRNVVLWGVKSARWVIPALLRAGPPAAANPLLTAVVKAVGTHGQGAIGGPIVVEAYETLMIDALSNNPKRRPTAAMVTAVIPFMHQLLQQRVAAYQKGLPPEPGADSRGTLFLVDATVWGLHTPPQRVTSIQAMSDLVGLGAQHAATASQGDLADLGYMIGLVSKAIAVVPQNASIQAQLGPAMKIDHRANAAQIQAAVGAIPAALKTVKEFAALTPPPAVAAAPAPAATPAANGGGGTNQPTTAPTTATTGPAKTASTSP